ncbi:MAG: ATP-binding cassette domain-containing protein [Lachnospiraceae bacterium]|nr:ATP-binding cassette domain-containing protein [Lachnospiraceae bacterium]
MEKVLTVENLIVEFKNKKSLFDKPSIKRVLNGVSFEINKGEIVGLVGESGSGKSTIAKSILGLIPFEGRIENYTARPQMVFQDPYSSLNPSKKVGWLLNEALYLDGVKDKDIRKNKVEEMINLVGLSKEHLERYPNELSGGQRQRVCIALSLISEPKLLLADEPVSALDVTIQAQILELLKELYKKMDLSILFISHDLRVVYNICDRVLILKKGEIVESGTPKEVYQNPKHEYTKQLLDSI